MAGLRWAIDVIEYGFGKSPNDGGLPKDVLHAETVVDGEELYLRRTMNCGAPYQQGYTPLNITALDRNGAITIIDTLSPIGTNK